MSDSVPSAVEAARRIVDWADAGKLADDEWLVENNEDAIIIVARAYLKACEALEKMRARDERNSSLPIWYREQIDAALGPLCEDCPPRRYPTDKMRCASCPRRADALSCPAPPSEKS